MKNITFFLRNKRTGKKYCSKNTKLFCYETDFSSNCPTEKEVKQISEYAAMLLNLIKNSESGRLDFDMSTPKNIIIPAAAELHGISVRITSNNNWSEFRIVYEVCSFSNWVHIYHSKAFQSTIFGRAVNHQVVLGFEVTE